MSVAYCKTTSRSLIEPNLAWVITYAIKRGWKYWQQGDLLINYLTMKEKARRYWK